MAITHECAASTDGSPCGSCGGNLDESSPAAQALSWGLMVDRWKAGGCSYEFDEDATWPLAGGRLKVKVEYEGRIWDICLQVLKRSKKFTVDLAGSSDGTGFEGSATTGGKPTSFGTLSMLGDSDRLEHLDEECK